MAKLMSGSGLSDEASDSVSNGQIVPFESESLSGQGRESVSWYAYKRSPSSVDNLSVSAPVILELIGRLAGV